MTFLQLEQLKVEQLPAVVELDNLCFGGLWTLEGYQREIASPNSRLLVLSSSKLDVSLQQLTHKNQNFLGIGCYWSILEEAHITILGIHPDYRSQGLGGLLLYTLLQDAAEGGLQRATLEVRVSNQVALRLYKKFSFQEAGKRRGYYKDPQEDALILWLKDLQTTEFKQNLAKCYEQVCTRLACFHWKLYNNKKIFNPVHRKK